MSHSDTWNPQQYNLFKEERSRPFYDLLSLVEKKPAMQVIDLGCGTGELTKFMHENLQAEKTTGLDRSGSMLGEAPKSKGLSFVQKAIEEFEVTPQYDLIFSNAALQWLPDHRSLMKKLRSALKPDGQLAVQVPANHTHTSHLVAAKVASEEPFRSASNNFTRTLSVLSVEEYSLLLYHVGFRQQKVRKEIYFQKLESREGVIEWVKGTLLTDYQKHLPPELFEKFLKRYKEALFAELPDEKPFPYPYARILMWGKL